MLKKKDVFLSRKQDQYRFSWYLPLAGLKLHWAADEERSPEVNIRLHTLRTKLYFLRQQLRQSTVRYHSEDDVNEPLLGRESNVVISLHKERYQDHGFGC